MLRRIAAQGGLRRLAEARWRNGRHPARRRPQRPRFRSAPAGGVLAVASGERPCRDRARLDPAQLHGSRAPRQGDLRAVANPQRPRRPNPARLCHQRARLGRGTQESDLLARPVARPPRGAGLAGDHQPVTGRLVLVWALVAGPAGAQRLAARVAAAPDGTVRLSFAARPGVCGDGQSVIAFECAGGKCGRGRWGRTITVDRGFDDDEVEYDCEPGPVRVSLRVRTGRVQSLRTYVAVRWVTLTRDSAVTDLR